MRALSWKYFGVGALVALAGTASGAVVWSYDGGTPSSTFPIPALSVTGGEKILRVYSTTSTEAIGSIELSGTVASGSSLCVIVASSNTSCEGGATPGSAGTSFGGLSFAVGSESLRDASKLRLNVSGNVTGPTTVGRIVEFRSGGTIEAAATITATAADPSSSVRAIGLVRPDGSLLASVVADQGSIFEVRVPNGPIGDLANSIQPAISGVNIDTIQATEINATITATGTLNFLNATTGGVHGSVDVGALQGLDGGGLPDPPVTVVDCATSSTARIEAGDIGGSFSLQGISNSTGTAGIYCDNFEGNITSVGDIDAIEATGSIATSEGAHWTFSVDGAIGSIKVDGACGPAAATSTDDGLFIQADSIGSLTTTSFVGAIAGFSESYCSLPVTHILGDLGVGYDEGNQKLFLKDVERFDVEGDFSAYRWLHMEYDAAVLPLVRIGGFKNGWMTVNGSAYPASTGNMNSTFIFNAKGDTLGVDEHRWPDLSPIIWYEDDGETHSYQVLLRGYTRTPAGFGGGSGGEVPFLVHTPQSDSLNNGEDTTTDLIQSHFLRGFGCDEQFAQIEFYGPVRIIPATGGSTRAPLSVELEVGVDTSDPLDGIPDVFYWSQVSHLMDFSVDSTNPRRVRICGKEDVYIPSGTFRVTTWPTEAHTRVLCDKLLPSDPNDPNSPQPDVRVAPMTIAGSTAYTFTLLPDCDTSAGDPYEPDCVADTGCGIELPQWACDSLDYNNDGLFPDTADTDDFLSVFSGGPCSTGDCNDIDYNNDDTFPDTVDIDAWLSVFSGGPCLWPQP